MSGTGVRFEVKQTSGLSGIRNYLAKPVTLESLFEKLLLWSSQGSSGIKNLPVTFIAERTPAIKNRDILDLKVIRNVFEINDTAEEGRQFFIELLEIYRKSTPEIFQQIRAALDSGETEAVYKLFHKAKGSSANIGAKSVTDLCSELETKCRDSMPSDIRQKVEDLDELYLQTMEAFHEYLYGPTKPASLKVVV